MIKWQLRALRLGLTVGAIVAFAVASGAGQRWGW